MARIRRCARIKILQISTSPAFCEGWNTDSTDQTDAHRSKIREYLLNPRHLCPVKEWNTDHTDLTMCTDQNSANIHVTCVL